jgi:hypothetical protein
MSYLSAPRLVHSFVSPQESFLSRVLIRSHSFYIGIAWPADSHCWRGNNIIYGADATGQEGCALKLMPIGAVWPYISAQSTDKAKCFLFLHSLNFYLL